MAETEIHGFHINLQRVFSMPALSTHALSSARHWSMERYRRWRVQCRARSLAVVVAEYHYDVTMTSQNVEKIIKQRN